MGLNFRVAILAPLSLVGIAGMLEPGFAQTIPITGLSPGAENLWRQCQDVTTRVIRQQTALMHISNAEEFGHLRPSFEALASMQDKAQIQAGVAGAQRDSGRSEEATLNAELVGCLGNARLAQLNGVAAQNSAGGGANGSAPSGNPNKELADAVNSGSVEQVSALLASGRYTVGSYVDIERNTPLHFAADRCQAPLIQFLLGRGADAQLTNKWGDTPQRIADAHCGPSSPSAQALRTAAGNAGLVQRNAPPAQSSTGSATAPRVATAPTQASPSAPGQNLTAAESQACIADITAFRQASSQRYAAGGGDAELVRQYTYQVQLFEGRCAGHPQAAAFVTNGRRFLEEARARMGSAAPPPLPPASPGPVSSASNAVSSQPSSPQIDTGNYSNCLTRILPGEPGAGNYGMLKNNCPFSVDVRYCNDGADANSFAATLSCTGSRNWGGSTSVGANDKETALVGGRTYWFACKKPAGVTDSTYNPGQGISARCK